MNTQQVQLKISLSEQLNQLLSTRAADVGVPVTQFVKHLIIKDVENISYPVKSISERTEKLARAALDDLDNAVDADTFFRTAS